MLRDVLETFHRTNEGAGRVRERLLVQDDGARFPGAGEDDKLLATVGILRVTEQGGLQFLPLNEEGSALPQGIFKGKPGDFFRPVVPGDDVPLLVGRIDAAGNNLVYLFRVCF